MNWGLFPNTKPCPVFASISAAVASVARDTALADISTVDIARKIAKMMMVLIRFRAT
ncbi:hypothetical protein [Mobiluncus sp.]|uniref:hypothetical protein n=1 Tax=Mobiluncus sp. TaxID=47293 RepID=UPI002A909094|nr:hypothetical protein [Mobiluncus sp.]MDY6077211.1 hypothetical protein [Mobiluncus sp.]